VEFVVEEVALGQVSPASLHSTKFSIIVITWGRYNRAEWTQLGLHPPLYELKKKNNGFEDM
jgi:hypothetical protein